MRLFDFVSVFLLSLLEGKWQAKKWSNILPHRILEDCFPKLYHERWLVLEIFAVASCFLLLPLLLDTGLGVPGVIFRPEHTLPVTGTESQSDL